MFTHILLHMCVCVFVCVWQRIWSCHFVITSANTGLERVDWSLPVGQPWEKMRSDRPHNTAWDVNNFLPPSFSLSFRHRNMEDTSRILKERGREREGASSWNERISLAFIFRKNLWHPLSLALMKVFGFLVFYPLTRGVCIIGLSVFAWCTHVHARSRVLWWAPVCTDVGFSAEWV